MKQTHDEAVRESFDKWDNAIGELVDRLEDAIRRTPSLGPILRPFLIGLGADIPRTRLGRFIERVWINYSIIRLERRINKTLARAHMVRR